MDKGFDSHVLRELRCLVAELEEGQEPSNIAFHEAVQTALRQDYYRERRKNTVVT
jgi:hypothetical protein